MTQEVSDGVTNGETASSTESSTNRSLSEPSLLALPEDLNDLSFQERNTLVMNPTLQQINLRLVEENTRLYQTIEQREDTINTLYYQQIQKERTNGHLLMQNLQLKQTLTTLLQEHTAMKRTLQEASYARETIIETVDSVLAKRPRK